MENATKKKHFQMPHTFVIVGTIILVAVVMTWIIPAGSYVRVENAQGIKVVDPNQFNFVERSPISLVSIPLYIVQAFTKNADLLWVILFSGGAFHLLTLSGALQAVIAKVAKRFSNKLYIFIPVLTLIFGLICTTQGVNTFIAFAPVMVMMTLAMGLDSISGAAIILLGGAVGFSTGTLNISTTLVAQKVAELPLYSGLEYRAFCFAVFYVVTNIYLIRYAMKIQKNPQLSPMYDLDKNNELNTGADLDSFGTLNLRKVLILMTLCAALALIVYGCIALAWDMAETAATFLALSVIVGFIAGFTPSDISKHFLEGCKKMLAAAIIIGLARAIGTILADGKIVDTVVYFLAGGLSSVPPLLQGPAMLIANTLINMVLTSGSGQAAAVMPIFTPLADLIGMTRQTAVLAFNFGDGFCNYILPTSTALMGITGAANIPYDRWMKFMWKMFLIWMAVGAVLLVVAQIIHLGPM
ncbi:MAG: YfcC family protein [Candidatus Fimivivens sp.]